MLGSSAFICVHLRLNILALLIPGTLRSASEGERSPSAVQRQQPTPRLTAADASVSLLDDLPESLQRPIPLFARQT
jgi:hypothetical protein